jgi:hypothetical protein
MRDRTKVLYGVTVVDSPRLPAKRSQEVREKNWFCRENVDEGLWPVACVLCVDISLFWFVVWEQASYSHSVQYIISSPSKRESYIDVLRR